MKHTACKTTNCRKWANLNSDGFCPKCVSVEDDDDCVGSVCNVCNSEIQEDDNKVIGCDVCNNWYHAECAGCPDELLKIIDAMTTDSTDENSTCLLGNLIWVCMKCNNDSPKTISISKNACKPVKVVDTIDKGCCTNENVMVDKSCNTNDASQINTNPNVSNTNDNSHISKESKYVAICKNYRYGKCNDENCSYSHPAKCLNYCRYGRDGCSGGFAKCNLLHPVLCRGSLKYNKCLDPDCTLAHLKGTIRKESNSMTTNTPAMPQNVTYPQQQNRRNPGPSHFDPNLLGFYNYRQTKSKMGRADEPVNDSRRQSVYSYQYRQNEFPRMAVKNDAAGLNNHSLTQQGQVSHKQDSDQANFLEILKELKSMKQTQQYFQQEMILMKSMMGTQHPPPQSMANQQIPATQYAATMNRLTSQ